MEDLNLGKGKTVSGTARNVHADITGCHRLKLEAGNSVGYILVVRLGKNINPGFAVDGELNGKITRERLCHIVA